MPMRDMAMGEAILAPGLDETEVQLLQLTSSLVPMMMSIVAIIATATRTTSIFI